jgi:hypothetical protein
MRTDWTRLIEHLDQLRMGEERRITVEELRSIVGSQELPESVNRVTLWDPLMGKKGGGLQRAIREAQCVPRSFEWAGSHDRRPELLAISLLRWGRGVMC